MQQYGMKFVKMKIPYIFMIATWIPIFVFIYLVPASADTQFYWAIERIIDEDLFGKVGMWSSTFPLAAKVITNYICSLSPIFAMAFTYRTIKCSTFENSNYDKLSLARLIFFLASWLALLLLVFYGFYMSSTDLANSRRFVILGKYKILYAIYSSALMFLIYILTLVSYFVFRFVPGAISRNMWKAK